MRTYTVTAIRWDGGWELHIDNEGVTQVRTLDGAERQVRDYLATIHVGQDFDDVAIDIAPDLGGLERAVIAARHEVQEAASAQARAAEHSRQVARQLRDLGLSVTDTAAVLGVSRGRVSQLTSAS
jgi:DNA-directed RNA polymerase specialized sigma24 family protein